MAGEPSRLRRSRGSLSRLLLLRVFCICGLLAVSFFLVLYLVWGVRMLWGKRYVLGVFIWCRGGVVRVGFYS